MLLANRSSEMAFHHWLFAKDHGDEDDEFYARRQDHEFFETQVGDGVDVVQQRWLLRERADFSRERHGDNSHSRPQEEPDATCVRVDRLVARANVRWGLNGVKCGNAAPLDLLVERLRHWACWGSDCLCSVLLGDLLPAGGRCFCGGVGGVNAAVSARQALGQRVGRR